MKKFKIVSILAIIFCSVLFFNFQVSAHNPPTCGQNDCGLIVGSKFYSQYYSPGNPDGTPVSANGGTWTKTSNQSCGSYYYQGYNYTLYPHRFVCSLPVDGKVNILLGICSLLGVAFIRKNIIPIS